MTDLKALKEIEPGARSVLTYPEAIFGVHSALPMTDSHLSSLIESIAWLFGRSEESVRQAVARGCP